MVDQMSVPESLSKVNRAFAERDEGLWFVGGCVRDWIRKVAYSDMDLATSATPEKQIEIYVAEGWRHIETGMKHGTITVIVDGDIYEITTCRTETNHDGRHAEVHYTRDINEDLGRRDLTVNAIAMVMDGTILDPFGGREDIASGTVRFVGEARRRIREDHLRILRWFRFLGRMGDARSPDREAVEAIRHAAESLTAISVERVWSEMQKIVSGPAAEQVLSLMQETGVGQVIGITNPDVRALNVARAVTKDAAVIMAAYAGDDALHIAASWKWSTDERRKTEALASGLKPDTYGIAEAKADLVKGSDYEAVMVVLAIRQNVWTARTMREWKVPMFPVKARDLLGLGMKQGLEVGRLMTLLKARWAASDYQMTTQRLLEIAAIEISE